MPAPALDMVAMTVEEVALGRPGGLPVATGLSAWPASARLASALGRLPRGPPALSGAAVPRAEPSQWVTAGATAVETTRVEPATAAISVGLLTSADVIGDRLWRRAWTPGRADEDLGRFRGPAGGRDTAVAPFARRDCAP